MTQDHKGRRVYYNENNAQIRVPSVTTILDFLDKPGLNDWKTKKTVEAALNSLGNHNLLKIMRFKSHKERHIKQATVMARSEGLRHAKLGTLFHELKMQPLSAIDFTAYNDIEVKLLENIMKSWHSFLADFSDSWKSQESELPVMGSINDYAYGGTTDIVFDMRDNTVLLVELKTARYLYDINAMQAAAYAHAYHRKVDKLWVLRLGKYGVEYEIKEVDYDLALEMFGHLIALYYEFIFKGESGVWLDDY